VDIVFFFPLCNSIIETKYLGYDRIKVALRVVSPYAAARMACIPNILINQYCIDADCSVAMGSCRITVRSHE